MKLFVACSPRPKGTNKAVARDTAIVIRCDLQESLSLGASFVIVVVVVVVVVAVSMGGRRCASADA